MTQTIESRCGIMALLNLKILIRLVLCELMRLQEDTIKEFIVLKAHRGCTRKTVTNKETIVK